MANLSSSNPLVALGQQGASGMLNATPGAGNQIFNPSSGQASQGVRSGGGLANGTAGEGNYAGMWWQAGGKTADGQNAVGGWQNGPNPYDALNNAFPPDLNGMTDEGSYKTSTASAPAAGGSGSSGSGGTGQSGASYPGLSAAMGGLNSSGGGGGGTSSGGGMNLSGLAGAFGSSVNPGPMVGAPGLGDTAIASAPPQTPDVGFSGSGGSGAQQLSAPTAGRQGIGARIYPSLQALLRTPAY